MDDGEVPTKVDESTLREVPIDEAMSTAIFLQQQGRLSDAEGIYRKILDVRPDHADALHYLGVLLHQQGQSEEGAVFIGQSLELAPDQADWWSNLGIVFKAMGKIDEAAEAYAQAIALDPNHANAYSNLGVLRRAQGRLTEAEDAYRAAIRIDDEHIDAYHNLGVLLAMTKRTQEAVVCYCKVTTLRPQHVEARRLLALAYCTIGQPEKAVEIFERWIEEDPANPIPRHMLAACSGQSVPERASDAYVEKVFDDFAASFDSKLAKLSYRAPTLIAAMLVDAGLPPARALDVLDAGCGTGLCGPLIAEYARWLVGVDLSGRMLEQAKERSIYHELVKGELTEYLRQGKERFDVIVSADTLVYFGALEAVIDAAAAALRPNGQLLFTVEETEEADTADYRIKPHGRYSHSRAYIDRVLTGAGLRPQIVRAELRMEAGAPVAGLVVRAVKAATIGDAHA
jgi:predicted TPR repeat methyltransferase